MKKSPASKKSTGKKPTSLRPRAARLAAGPGAIPTPQITSPINGTGITAGQSIRVHVTTNRPDIQSIVWLIAPDGSVVDKVAVTWPSSPPYEADVVVTVPDPAAAYYTLELEQDNDVDTVDGGTWVHAVQLPVE